MSRIIRVRCISLWQPWASLLAVGPKFLETRGWDTKVRGEIYIHASKTKTPIKEARNYPAWWVSLVEEAIGVCEDKWLTDLPYGGIIGKGNLTDTCTVEHAEKIYRDQIPFGNFDPGRFCHYYEDRQAVPFIPLRGMQGFFFAEIPEPSQS